MTEYAYRKKAADYYNLPKGWVLHHKDESLKYKDPERYHQWRIEDLVPMSKSDHRKIHSKGDKNVNYGKHLSKETKEKLREANLGKCLSEETKEKIGAAWRGKHWKVINGKRVWYTD